MQKAFPRTTGESAVVDASKKQAAGERVVPLQYRVRDIDPRISLPFRVSKFVDFGGTSDRNQINTMSCIVNWLFHERQEWFPRLSEYQPVPRNIPIKAQVSGVAKFVYEKGINDAVFRAFLRESETIEDLLRYLENTTNRKTLYKRTW